jgi:hypothetical protein
MTVAERRAVFVGTIGRLSDELQDAAIAMASAGVYTNADQAEADKFAERCRGLGRKVRQYQEAGTGKFAVEVW